MQVRVQMSNGYMPMLSSVISQRLTAHNWVIVYY